MRKWVGATGAVDKADSGQLGYAPFIIRSSANMRQASAVEVVSVKFRTFGDRQGRRKVLIVGLGRAAGGVPGAGTEIHENIEGGV